MSIENHSTGDKPSLYPIGEGRRGQTGQQPASVHRSGGVSVEGTSASSAKVSWENSGDGPEAQASAQAGQTSEAGGVAGEVGVLRSSQEAPVTGVERRRDTCSDVRRDGGRRLRKEISRHDASSSSTLTIVLAANVGTKPGSESRIWEIRPFGSMRGGRESVIGLVPLNPTSPAYSTTEIGAFRKTSGQRPARSVPEH
jgi:hypothetical protein